MQKGPRGAPFEHLSTDLDERIIVDGCHEPICGIMRRYRCSRPRTVAGLDCWQEKVFVDKIIEAVTEAVRYQA